LINSALKLLNKEEIEVESHVFDSKSIANLEANELFEHNSSDFFSIKNCNFKFYYN